MRVGTLVALVVMASATVASADDAEAKFGQTVARPLCEAHWLLESEQKTMAFEKANPSGVVDLQALHTTGQIIQATQANIAKLSAQYVKVRKRAFSGWKTEPACIVAYDEAMAQNGCTRVEDAGGKSHHWTCPGQ